MIKYLRRFHQDSLFRNSFYLMLATAVMAGFGFFFWLFSAHLVQAESIGIATSLISAMNIIAIFSLIGFDSAIVRFLAHSNQRNDKLNTAIILVSATAAILSTIFILSIQHLSPRLSFIAQNTGMSIAFVLFCIMSGVNILTDAVFLAYRETKFTLIINTIFSFVKMILPFAFISFGAFGIFTAAAVGQSVGFALSIVTMIWKFEFKPQFVINRDVLKQVWLYCSGNYIAGALNLLPITVLPIIITNNLGPSKAAYFYVVMMVANLLYVIPQATTKSLFAEGSFDENTIQENIKKTARLVIVLLLPAILLIFIFGKYLLHFFGKDYSAGGLNFLYICSFSGISVSIYSVAATVLRVEKQLTSLILTNFVYAVSIVGLSYALLPLGLEGIGFAWLIGTSISGILGIAIYHNSKKLTKEIVMDGKSALQ